MRTVALASLAFLLVSATLSATEGTTGPTQISFKVKNLDTKDEVAALKKELSALTGVKSVDVARATRKVVLTLKEKATLLLSAIKDAVKKASGGEGDGLEVEACDITIAGKVRISTNVTEAKSKDCAAALKKIKNVTAVEVVKGKGTQFDLTAKEPKGVTLSTINKTAAEFVEKGEGEEKAIAISDVEWVAAKETKPKKPNGHG